MKDRIAAYPGRVELAAVAGQPGLYDMTAADSPLEAGTPLSKATLLPDSVASHLGLDPAEDPKVADALMYGVPAGGIIMWSGAPAGIPTGWALCNGANGTPDLRGRFIVGAGGDYAAGTTGGAEAVTLTTEQLPSHNHANTMVSAGAHTHTIEQGASGNRYGDYTQFQPYKSAVAQITNSSGAHTHTLTNADTGGGEAHENRPPYYALCFIMKL